MVRVVVPDGYDLYDGGEWLKRLLASASRDGSSSNSFRAR